MSEIKMLPLPNWLLEGFTDPTIKKLKDYARAVAEHNVKLATAELHRQFGCELRDPNGTIWDHAAKLQAEIEALRAEMEEARGLVTEANNSLYGSQSYFHSLDGGPYNRHHLANGIEDLKRRSREGYAAETRAERLAEALRASLEAVRDTLQQSYQNAGQECCGRGGMQECCGEPEPVWAPEDQAVMDKLAPIERMLSSALRDHDEEGKDG